MKNNPFITLTSKKIKYFSGILNLLTELSITSGGGGGIIPMQRCE